MELITATKEMPPGTQPFEFAKPHWYAVYTCARHEKCVAEQMGRREIRAFLPVYRSVRRWKDRRKEIEMALFPSYVFVRVALQDRLRVLEIPGVVSIVGAGSKPEPLADHEIEPFLHGVEGCLKMEPHPFLRVGRRVRLRSGPMAGMEGVLLRRKNGDGVRLIVSLEILMRAVAVEIDEADVEACD
ncbi:MAG TPA: UpxY family transcription antiterminator [Candidatus Sulfotelmatobacter sp.]|jgi:transcription antitermination factor NusG